MLVARMRRLAFLLFVIPAIQVSARDDSLFTSSVTYCSEPDALLIQQFDVAYFQKNSSIWFNISAASVEPNVSVSANIMLNVYGMHPFNFTLDICSLFGGSLCPLPTYNFTGSDSLPLPSSLGVTDKIPSIAFGIPDLEAFAQLSLTDVNTGELKACVQATLSNGWSARQPAVEWGTGALGLLALLSAIWYSQSPDALAPFRLFDLLYLFQWTASTALLDLNYSSVYIAFATNFSWALGLFSSTATSPIQLSINNMRHLTGGNMADATSGSAVALVNRELSPYNVITSLSLLSQMTNLAKKSLVALGIFPTHNFVSRTLSSNIQELDGAVQTVTSTSSNVLQAGVPIYVGYVGIATANAFMTVFLVALMVFAVLVVTLVLGYSFMVLAGQRMKNSNFLRRRELYPAFARGWLLRVCLIVFTPVSIFALYQWTLKDSWLSILLSVVLLLGVVGYISFSIFHVFRLAIRATPSALYTQPKAFTAYSPLFALYRPERYFASIPFLVGILLKAIFTAFAQANGEVQVISILVIECAILAYILFFRPHKTRGADILAIYLALTRVACTGLLIAFIQRLNVTAIPRVAIGAVIAVIISVAIIVMFVNTLVNLGLIKVPSRLRRSKSASEDASALEKGADEENNLNASRPRNPTPERNVPLDPNINQPYPESPSDIATEESVYSEESGSTTLGSLLPRRWSLQPSAGSHSRPPSQSQYSSTNASSPRYSHPPSPLYSHSASHSRHPTIDEHGPIVL